MTVKIDWVMRANESNGYSLLLVLYMSYMNGKIKFGVMVSCDNQESLAMG